MSKQEIRAVSDKLTYDKEARTISGYAIVYNARSLDLGGFTETIKPGAVTRCLSSQPDIRALLEHDSKQLLGRTASGTLQLKEDAKGLRFDIKPPNTSAGRDAIELLDRGDISGASFCFTVNDNGQRWIKGKGEKLRELTDISISEISLVSCPAYPDTSVAIRSMQQWEGDAEAILANKKKLIRLWELP